MLLVPGFALAVGVGLLLFIPAYLTVSSIFTLVVTPQQIWAVARDRRVRRNHSCEHATVNVLEQWYGPLPHVGGVAVEGGFYIWGADMFHPNALIRAAQEGLERMKRGEASLALHPRCGTSLAAARFVFAAIFLWLLLAVGYFTFGGVLLALVASWMAGRPLGMLLQRFFTTTSDVAPVEITAVSWTDRPRLGPGMFLVFPGGAYFFHTAQ